MPAITNRLYEGEKDFQIILDLTSDDQKNSMVRFIYEKPGTAQRTP